MNTQNEKELLDYIDVRIKHLDSKRLKETEESEVSFLSGQVVELKNLKKLITGEN